MSNSTVTLQNVVNLASVHADLLPLAGVGGYQSEPALSICNDLLQTLLASPLDWKFNRTEMNMFVTAPNRQDYLFAGAVAFTSAATGNVSRGAGIGLVATPGVSRTGTTVTVTTLEAHGFAAGDTVYMLGNADSQFNSTFTQTDAASTYSGGWTILTTPTTTTFTFTHATSGSTTSGASGITDFGWLVSAVRTNITDTAPVQGVTHLRVVRELQPHSLVTTPEKVCMLSDLGTGVLKIRLLPRPGSIYGINLVYQSKAPLKTALTATWSPFPDELSFVYRQGFLAHAYRYINSARSEVEWGKFQQAIAKGMGSADREPDNVYLVPENPLITSYGYGWGI